jgi:hypothetical protein
MGEKPDLLRPLPSGEAYLLDEADDRTASASAEDIRDDIEQSRAQMSDIIDAIQEKLSPRRLVDDAKETVRAATVGKVTDMMNSASDSATGLVDRISPTGLTNEWATSPVSHRFASEN